jgi:hypothetical protein
MFLIILGLVFTIVTIAVLVETFPLLSVTLGNDIIIHCHN